MTDNITNRPSAHEVLASFRTREIIDSAVELIRDEGFERFTMDRVAERAGISKGTIYLYFKDKEQLIKVLLKEIADLFIEDISLTSEKPGSLRERLLKLAIELYRFSEENRDLILFIHGYENVQKKLTSCTDDETHNTFNRLVTIVSRLFKEAMDEGEIALTNPDLISLLFLGSLQNYWMVEYRRPELNIKTDAKFLVDLYLNGLSSTGEK